MPTRGPRPRPMVASRTQQRWKLMPKKCMVYTHVLLAGCSTKSQHSDPQVTQAEDSPQLVSALKAHAAVTREQKSTLAHVLEGFVHTLHTSSDAAQRVLSADSWDGHTS